MTAASQSNTPNQHTPKVVWLFSLARSGSSVAVYSAAAPWGHAVADEILGPWDRTGAPYHYPPAQKDLVDLFQASDHALTPDVVSLFNRVAAELNAASGRPKVAVDGVAPEAVEPRPTGVVIAKHPHLRPGPEAFRDAFPDAPCVYLIRNPLHRLNSMHARGWHKSFGPKQDLARYKQFATWWLEQPIRLSYDQFKAQPRAFFRGLYTAWNLPFTDTHIDAAIDYSKHNYHDSSLEMSDRDPAQGVLSETEFALPAEALDLYLKDPFIADLMTEMGWSMDPSDYGFVGR